MYQALLDHGFIPDVDFTFQSSMLGGRMELGGLVADFVFPQIKVILQVQGYWHTITMEHQVRDDEQVLILQSLGYEVLEVWPNTIEDPAALDYWLDKNIMTLWGTSSQGLASGGGGNMTWLQGIALNLLIPMNDQLDTILGIVRGFRG
jgi:hypothetical protein